MTSKKVLLSSLSLTTFCVVGNVANAYEFNDKLYAKLYANIGYEASIPNNVTGSKGDGLFHAPTVSVGGNLFYNLNDTFNPFVGLEAKGKFNLTSKLDNYDVYKFNEFFNLNAKIGSKIKINKNVSVSPYVLAGMTVAQIKVNKDNLGRVGGGIDLMRAAENSVFKINTDAGEEIFYSGLFAYGLEDSYQNDYLTARARGFTTHSSGLLPYGINGTVYFTEASNLQQAIYNIMDEFTPSHLMGYARFDANKVYKLNTPTGTIYAYMDVDNMTFVSGYAIPAGRDEYETDLLSSGDGSGGTTSVNMDDKTKVGFNVGAGIDVLIKERFTIGAEYRYSEVSFGSGFKVKTNNIGARFGIQFL